MRSGVSKLRWPTVVALTTTAIYLGILPFLPDSWGASVAIASVIPVSSWAWAFALRGGLLAGLVIVLANALFVTVLLGQSLDEWLREGGIAGSTALLGIGVIVGWLRGTRIALERELRARSSIEDDLRNRVKFNDLTASISTRFATEQIGNVDAAIDETLARLADFSGVDRCNLFQFSEDRTSMNNTHEWCARGIDPFGETHKGVHVDRLPWLVLRILESRTVQVDRVADLPAEASIEKAEFLSEGIQSVLARPVVHRGTCLGFLGLQSIRAAKQWSPTDVSALTITAEIMAASLDHERALRLLREVNETLESRVIERTAAAQWSEENNRALVEASPDGIIRTSLDGTIESANPRMAEIVGASSPEWVVGRPITDLVVKREQAQAEAFLSRARTTSDSRAEGESGAAVFSAQRLDGGSVPVEIKWNAMTDPTGARTNFVVVVSDISKRLQAERSVLRAAQLSSVGQLAAGMAHEVNNPLASIVLFTDLLLSNDLDADVAKDVGKIKADALRARRVVQNLMTFAREHEPVKEYEEIGGVVRHAIDLMEHDLRLNHIEVQTEYADEPLYAMADRHQLTEVFVNLIVNAEHAMAEAHGKGVLKVLTSRDEDRIRISITDDGPGLTPELIEKIFDPFFTTKAEDKGTGLGLSICHGIIGSHQGDLWVESEPGRGATFHIAIPSAESDLN